MWFEPQQRQSVFAVIRTSRIRFCIYIVSNCHEPLIELIFCMSVLQVQALLVASHYKTTPDDLLLLADAPVRAARARG
jgi:hypothetical protein